MSIALGVLALGATFLGARPSCPPGQAVTAETFGHCCWPKQMYSKAQDRCVGVPACPPGTAVSGEACEAVPEGSFVPPPPPPVWPDPATPPPGALPPEPRAAPAPPQEKPVFVDGLLVPPNHHVERVPRKSLWIPGVALFGAGWLFALIADFTSLVFRSDPCTRWVSETAWIPLAGPAIAAGGQGYIGAGCTSRIFNPLGTALAVLDTVLQVGGVTMFVLGLTIKESEVVPGPAPTARASDAPRLELALGSPGSAAGFSARLTW